MRASHPRQLGTAFVVALRGQCLDVRFEMTGDLNPVVTIPAQHPEVGPVTVEFFDGEVTVGIGDHFHCHFDPATYGRQGQADPQAAAVAAAARYVADFVKGRILFHVVFVNGQYGGSGTSYLDEHDPLQCVPSNARLYTWAGPWSRPNSESAS